MAEFLLQSKHLLELNTSPGTGDENFVRLGAGITSMEPDPNDETAQDRYFDGEGFAETDVIGAQLVLTFSGHRKYGDAAQDYIFGLLLEPGPARRTTFRWTLPDGSSYEGPVTIAAITGPGGEAGAKGEIGFEIHFNGKPEFTAGNGISGTSTASTQTATRQLEEQKAE
jgi:hypothetical protein